MPNMSVHISPPLAESLRGLQEAQERTVCCINCVPQEEVEHELELARDELMGLITHDLRSPLTVIVGFARLLASRRKALDENEVDEALAELQHEAVQLQSLVETMLNVARLSSDQRLDSKRLLVPRLVAERIAEHRKDFPERQINIAAGAGHMPLVRGNRTALGQVIDNLLSNAEKYSPPSEPIDVTIDVCDGSLRVRILDRGAGVRAKEARELFQPFRRFTGTRRTPGTGIGLALARRLVEVQDGKIWAQPRPGGGTEFGFSLPIIET